MIKHEFKITLFTLQKLNYSITKKETFRIIRTESFKKMIVSSLVLIIKIEVILPQTYQQHFKCYETSSQCFYLET